MQLPDISGIFRDNYLAASTKSHMLVMTELSEHLVPNASHSRLE
jgi:hypothetical protein